MHAAVSRPEDPPVRSDSPRRNEILVTRQVSTTSHPRRPDSADALSGSTMPHAVPQQRQYHSYRPQRQPVAPRPLSEFSINDDASSIAMSLNTRAQENSTSDLAYFLKTTQPPTYARPAPERANSLNVPKKNAFAKFRPGTSARAGTRINQNSPIILPQHVASKTSASGKKYYHIQVPDSPTYRTLDPGSQFSPSSSNSNGQTAYKDYAQSSISTNPQVANSFRSSGQRASDSTALSSTYGGRTSSLGADTNLKPSPHQLSERRSEGTLDVDTAANYQRYLKSGSQLGAYSNPPSRGSDAPHRQLVKPASTEVFGGQAEKSQMRQGPETTGILVEAPATTPEQVATVDSGHQRLESQSSQYSDSTSYKPSIAIHANGLPPRTSSVPGTGLVPPGVRDPSVKRVEDVTPPLAVPLSPPMKSASPGPSESGSEAEIMQATSGQVLRGSAPGAVQGFYGPNIRKPPRPGPPPMRSLPSLPEGSQDDLRNSSRPISPSSQLSSTSQIFRAESPIKDGASVRSLAASDVTSLAGSTSESLRLSRRSREERVKARKMRDLQTIRARHENKKLDKQFEEENVKKLKADEARYSQTPTMTSDSSSGDGRYSRISINSLSSRRLSRQRDSLIYNQRPSYSPTNAFSPIMLVVEHEPGTGVFRTGEPTGPLSPLQAARFPKPRKSHSSNTITRNTRSGSPSFPSSDDEAVDSSRRHTAKPSMDGIARAYGQSHTPGGKYASHVSKHHRQDSQSQLEQRVEAMERKNLLLESALLAVIQASPGMGIIGGGTGAGVSQQLDPSSPRPSGERPTFRANSPLENLMRSMSQQSQHGHGRTESELTTGTTSAAEE
jgi:hypothetical protein